ncbi:hypothetical protein HNP83_005560 [Rhizobium leguminosarum]|nr:hypothetical protein [Rhizobium leguminosarum]
MAKYVIKSIALFYIENTTDTWKCTENTVVSTSIG